MASLYAPTGDGFARLDEAGEAWTAAVRTLVGGTSPIQLGPPALMLDVEPSDGWRFTTPVPPEFQAFAYVLDGAAEFGANKRRATHSQVVLLGPGEEFALAEASTGTRLILSGGKPHGEAPVFKGPFVD